jgi:hypothetical protein
MDSDWRARWLKIVVEMFSSEIVALRESAEDADDDAREDKGTENSLQEDGILNLAKGRLLDPDFTVKDLADDIALLVLGNPGLVLPTVGGVMRHNGIERVRLHLIAGRVVVGREQLPGAHVTMMHAVQNDAHALPSRDERGDAEKKSDDGEHAPCSASAAEGNDGGSHDTSNDATNAETTSKDDARTVAVTDGPANEVGVSLEAEGPFNCLDDVAESRRVSGVLESM